MITVHLRTLDSDTTLCKVPVTPLPGRWRERGQYRHCNACRELSRPGIAQPARRWLWVDRATFGAIVDAAEANR